MKVLTIVHYDTNQGSVEDIVQIPEGKTEDDVFLAWIRVKRNKPDLTMEEVTKNDGYLYHWEACEVKTFDQLENSAKEITS